MSMLLLVLAFILAENDGNDDGLKEKASTCGEAKNANVTASVDKDVALKYTISKNIRISNKGPFFLSSFN